LHIVRPVTSMDPLAMNPAGLERRRAPRVPLAAKGTVVNRSAVGSVPIDVITSNVSEDGLQLRTRNGEILSVHDFLVISFPGLTTPEPIQYKAQVAWINRASWTDQGAWTVGCSFFGMPVHAVLHLLVWAHREGGRVGVQQPA